MFNKNSKKKNILLNSAFGVIEQLVVYITAFLFRTIFLYVLSKEYLGIAGLFSNILQIFSLAELGIGGVIAYRMYAPVKTHDEDKCAQLLNFYKHIYFIISCIVFLLGLAFFPFISFTIADTSEIPADVNLNIVYWLFVIQNVISYFCVYWQVLLTADQKNYVLSLGNSIYNVASNVIKILFLLFTKNYTLVLTVGIIANLLYNVILSIYIKAKYKSIVNRNANKLSKSEKRQIFKDTGAMMCHKIGYVVLNSTDSIILSKFIGLSVLGAYSNYQLIASAVDTLLNKLLGNFVSTIGNFSVDASSEQKFDIYKKLFFVNMWLASFCTICFFILINPFIQLWLGSDYLLDFSVSIVISLNIFFNSSGIINSVFINATGLFVKDKLRPLFQAVLNLVISIVLVIKIGIVGVFIGTVASIILTVWWRQGVLLYHNVFKKSVLHYFVYYILWIFCTVAIAVFFYFICKYIPFSLLGVIARFAVCILGINLLYFILFYKTKSFTFYKDLIKSKIFRKDAV